MVVLGAGGASYWVVNTLLDTLSNETMLEIAKGLDPSISRVALRDRTSRLGIFGAGWVGLVTGACFADLGHGSSSVTWCPNESSRTRAISVSTSPASRSCSAATAIVWPSRSMSTS